MDPVRRNPFAPVQGAGSDLDAAPTAMPVGTGKAPDAAAPAAADSAAATNRAEREQFFASLGAMEGLSPRFLDYVRERLGLAGRAEIAATPLEEREMREILSDAQRQVASAAVQVTEVVTDAVEREIEDAFLKGEKASFADVLAELASILPDERLPQAAKIAFEIFREELKVHLKEVRGLFVADGMRTNRPGEAGEAFAKYAAAMLGLARRAAVEPNFDYDREISIVLNFGVALRAVDLAVQMVSVVQKLRVAITRYRTDTALADAKEKAALSQLKIRELIEQIKEAFQELDAEIQKFLAQLREKLAGGTPLMQALRAAAAKRLERELREWTKEVAGYEERLERLRDETRDEITDRIEIV